MGRRRTRTKSKRCRCLDQHNRPCASSVVSGTLFCEQHQNCPGSPLSGSEPAYQPELYNGNVKMLDSHNCYAYGMDVRDPKQLTQCDGNPDPKCQPHFHQPGGTKGLSKILRTAKGRTCKTVDYLMRQDVPELQPTTFQARCPVGTSKIALVVDPGEDYHYYREDKDGFWSHKDGGNPVKRFDADGFPIINPQTASRDYRPKGSFLNYEDFCGFYCAPRGKQLHLARGGARSLRNSHQSPSRSTRYAYRGGARRSRHQKPSRSTRSRRLH
jgi:hypothetical protein